MFRAMTMCGVILLAGAGASAQGTVTLDQVTGAATAEELLALGAHRVGAAEFNRVVVGRTMDEGPWIWTINADGTDDSAADDGSWTDSGTWELVGDRFCRQSPDYAYRCRNVYMIGGYLRMEEEDGALSDWTVKVP